MSRKSQAVYRLAASTVCKSGGMPGNTNPDIIPDNIEHKGDF